MGESLPNAASGWRPANSPSSGSSAGRWRRWKVLLLAVAVLALTGAATAWVFYFRPFARPYLLPLYISEYGEGFPVRGWVRQDREALRGLRWRQRDAFTSQQRALLLGELRALERQRDQTVVVSLSAYALTNPGGELCLLPVDARLATPSTWLPLREVLSHVRNCPARHKLLLLDIMQPFTDLRRRICANDAAQRLAPLLDELLLQDPRLSVLCACSPGQVSVAAEELGQTVFGYFLARGLRGQADGFPSGRRNGRVSLLELAGYVTDEVDRWVMRHRQQRQTPQLLGARADFPLAEVEVGAAAEDGRAALERTYPTWLRAGWELRDQWWADESYRQAPDLFRQLQAALLRAEEKWRGGIAPDTVRDDLNARCERLAQRRAERLRPADSPEVSSLAQAFPRGARPPDREDAQRELQRLLALDARTRTPKPAGTDVARLASGIEQLLKQFSGKPWELAWVVFESASETRPTPEGLKFLAGLLVRARVPAYRETQLLTRLAGLPTSPGPWPAESVQLALQGMREREQAATADRRALPWVAGALTAASRSYREGLALLMGKAADRARARAPLAKGRDGYRAINRDLQIVEEAQRCRDEALMLLPGYVPCLEVDDSAERAWFSAVAIACRLREALASPPELTADRAARLQVLAELTETLRTDPEGLKRLRRALEPERLHNLINRRKHGDFTDERSMRGLLATPWPTARQRLELWTAWRDLSEALGARARLREALPAPDTERAVAAERRRASQRDSWSEELRKLEGGV